MSLATITRTNPSKRQSARCLLLPSLVAASLFVAGAHAAGVPDTIAQRALACAACHGKEGRATRDGYFPRIAGKPAGYLYNQLVNFREGRRRYPAMSYMVEHLGDDYLMELAVYFSGQRLPYPVPEKLPASGEAGRGRALVENGDRARNIPACVSCHGAKLTGVLPAIPSLVGLSRDYLSAQFGAWRTGARRAAAPDCMGELSRKLSPDDINAVTSWLAAMPAPDNMAALPRGAVKMPLACGSAPE